MLHLPRRTTENSEATSRSINLFWFWWVVSTALAAILSMFVANQFISRYGVADDFYRYLLLWGSIGVAQWVVMELTGKHMRMWAIATAAGGALASFAFFFALETKLLTVFTRDIEAGI